MNQAGSLRDSDEEWGDVEYVEDDLPLYPYSKVVEDRKMTEAYFAEYIETQMRKNGASDAEIKSVLHKNYYLWNAERAWEGYCVIEAAPSRQRANRWVAQIYKAKQMCQEKLKNKAPATKSKERLCSQCGDTITFPFYKAISNSKTTLQCHSCKKLCEEEQEMLRSVMAQRMLMRDQTDKFVQCIVAEYEKEKADGKTD